MARKPLAAWHWTIACRSRATGSGGCLLREIGPRLSAALGEHANLICRLGGDECTLHVPGIDTREASLQLDFELLEALRQAFAIDGMQLELGRHRHCALLTE